MESLYHKYRPWGGHPYGTKPGYDYETGRRKAIEPFPGACGDCSKAKENHISEMTHEQKLQLLRNILEDSKEQAKKIQETLNWFIREMSHGDK